VSNAFLIARNLPGSDQSEVVFATDLLTGDSPLASDRLPLDQAARKQSSGHLGKPKSTVDCLSILVSFAKSRRNAVLPFAKLWNFGEITAISGNCRSSLTR
jgi:hypothetical protein